MTVDDLVSLLMNHSESPDDEIIIIASETRKEYEPVTIIGDKGIVYIYTERK